MEIISLHKDIKTFYVTAKTFPMGVHDAHEKIHALLPTTEDRQFYGISNNDTEGRIIYRAAVAEAFENEAKQYDCPTFIIKKGSYLSETLKDYYKDVSIVGKTFQAMLKDPRLDNDGYCLEIYPNGRDIQCLVKIKDD
jgi:hypothetical protein